MPAVAISTNEFFTSWDTVFSAYLPGSQSKTVFDSTEYGNALRASASFLTAMSAVAIPGGQTLSGQNAWNWANTNKPPVMLQWAILPRGTSGGDTLPPAAPGGLTAQ